LSFLSPAAPGAVAIVGRGPDAIDTQLAAIGDDLDTTCDLALAVTEIDAATAAEDAVEAIRTAVDAAIAPAVADRATMAAGNVLLRYDDSVITTKNQMRRALDALWHQISYTLG
jgi:hypothetical protein